MTIWLECWGQWEGTPPEDEKEDACQEGVQHLSGQWT